MFSMWAGLATLPVLCLITVLVLVSVIRREPFNGTDDDDTSFSDWSKVSDAEAEDLMRRLRRSVSDVEATTVSQLRQQFVRLKYPWAVRRHFLPNYLMNGHRVRSKSNPTGDLTRERYVDAVKVFVHVPRTSGASLIQCVGRMKSANNASLLMAPQTTDDYRSTSWDRPDALVQRQRNRFDVHAGVDSFGVCDSVHQRPCSYFTVLREPFEQAVSSYHHCRTSLGDPQCNVINANRVNLRDWIILHGGHLFRRFLFDSRLCNKSIDQIARTGNDSASSAIGDDQLMDTGHASCWYKHRVWVDTFPEEDRRILLDYVLENLERQFAVVGLYEDMETTLRTLEFVYGMAFSECRSTPTSSRTRDSKVRFSVNSVTSDAIDAELEDKLRYDVDVQYALEYDTHIYRRAREVVSQQNRLLFNRLKL